MGEKAEAEASVEARPTWWGRRSEKFRMTVLVAFIGAMPGLLAGSAAFLKKDDDQTARDVYSVLIKLIERLASEHDATQRNIEALHAQVTELTKQVDTLSRQVESTPTVIDPPPPLLPTPRTRIRLSAGGGSGGGDVVAMSPPASATPHPPHPPAAKAPPSPADVDKDGVIDLPEAWPE